MTTQEMLHAAQGAKMPLALADADAKNAALEAMAVALIAAQDKIRKCCDILSHWLL